MLRIFFGFIGFARGSIKLEKPHILQKAEVHSKTITSSKPGRKKLPVEEKASETVTSKLTIAEKKAFDKECGDILGGTFLRNYLKRNTELLGSVAV